MMERLPAAARLEFESLLHTSSYRPNRIVFLEGRPAAGLYVVLDGEIRVSISSTDGRRLNVGIARKGEILGLSSALSSGVHNATAETIYPAKLAYIGRDEFLAFLARHPASYLVIVEELSRRVSVAFGQMRMVALSHSAPEKLARLLLEWSENSQASGDGGRLRFAMTHEQIGEFIGASRETVTRTLTNFKRRRLVRFEGSMLTIPNRAALASFAGN